MKRDEAERIIKILLTADGGCEYCVSSLLDLFSKEFPEFKDLIKEAFRKKYGEELENFMKKRYRHGE